MEKVTLLIIIAIVAPLVKCLVPGTFFWKPRLALDLTIPTDKSIAHKPTWQNIRDGFVVLIDGYQIGLTVLALAECYSDTIMLPHLNPTKAMYHNNVYRWGLRHLSLLPDWLGGKGKYCDSHKVWNRRFYYLDEFVPKWMQKVFFYVDEKEWDIEKKEYARYKKYAEPAFGKHYKYPKRVFDNYKEFQTVETVENLDGSSVSI